jgi:hypothetical protein
MAFFAMTRRMYQPVFRLTPNSRARAVTPGQWIVLDEVRKIPQWLDEVHRLLEARPAESVRGDSSIPGLLKPAGAAVFADMAGQSTPVPASAKPTRHGRRSITWVSV